MIFCRTFLKGSTGCWADTAATVQAQLVTGTSERKQNIATERTPHSVDKPNSLFRTFAVAVLVGCSGEGEIRDLHEEQAAQGETGDDRKGEVLDLHEEARRRQVRHVHQEAVSDAVTEDAGDVVEDARAKFEAVQDADEHGIRREI